MARSCPGTSSTRTNKDTPRLTQAPEMPGKPVREGASRRRRQFDRYHRRGGRQLHQPGVKCHTNGARGIGQHAWRSWTQGVASRAFAHEEEEGQAKRSGQEPPRNSDAEMGELVPHGFDNCKDATTTPVHNTRHKGDSATDDAELQAIEDCHLRHEGRHYVRADISRKNDGRMNPRWNDSQTSAAIVRGSRGVKTRDEPEVRMHSGEDQVALTTNSSKVAEEVATMTQGVTLHEAVETGAREQCTHSVSWIMDVPTATEPNQAQHRARAHKITARPSRSREVAAAGYRLLQADGSAARDRSEMGGCQECRRNAQVEARCERYQYLQRLGAVRCSPAGRPSGS